MVWRLGDRIGGVTAMMEETSGATLAFAAESRTCRCPSSTTLPSLPAPLTQARVAVVTAPTGGELRHRGEAARCSATGTACDPRARWPCAAFRVITIPAP